MTDDDEKDAEVRWSLVRRVRTKIRRGDYDRPEVLEEAAARIAEALRRDDEAPESWS